MCVPLLSSKGDSRNCPWEKESHPHHRQSRFGLGYLECAINTRAAGLQMHAPAYFACDICMQANQL